MGFGLGFTSDPGFGGGTTVVGQPDLVPTYNSPTDIVYLDSIPQIGSTQDNPQATNQGKTSTDWQGIISSLGSVATGLFLASRLPSGAPTYRTPQGVYSTQGTGVSGINPSLLLLFGAIIILMFVMFMARSKA